MTEHCESCTKPFTFTRRKYTCSDCGGIFCASCTGVWIVFGYFRAIPWVSTRFCRVCEYPTV